MNPGSELAMKEFCQRASDILDKWAPLLLEGLSHRHWAFQGDFSLLYISANDGDFSKSLGCTFIADQALVSLRTSSEALSIVYGLANEVPLPALFWPEFMC